MHICSKRSVFSRSRDASLVTKKLRVGLGRYRHRSQFSPTNCGEQHLDNDRSLDKRWKSRAADTKSDRKSTRLNSSHSQISYAVFCLKKKKKTSHPLRTRR